MIGWVFVSQLALASGGVPEGAVSESVPVREQRRIYLGGNLGWNDFGGLGVSAGFNFHPRFAVRGGAGIGLGGARVGAQGRFNILESNLTPYLGAGLVYALGVDNITANMNGASSQGRVRPGAYLQGLAGLEYLSRGGFTFGFNVGYSLPLFRNVEVTSGEDSQPQRNFISTVFSPGGIVAGISMGVTL